jgi:hypothetical protein
MTDNVACRATSEIQDGGYETGRRIKFIRITYGSEVLNANYVVSYLKQMAEVYNN